MNLLNYVIIVYRSEALSVCVGDREREFVCVCVCVSYSSSRVVMYIK